MKCIICGTLDAHVVLGQCASCSLAKAIKERDRYKEALDHIASDKLECDRCRVLVGLKKLAAHYENLADEALAERAGELDK